MLGSPFAIVDIGSNSVRLVVYAGSARVPSPIFNEKVMAGLGRDMSGGLLAEAAQERALAALRRFRILVDQMQVGRIRVVATAAVRDAHNGAAFIARVRATGFDPEILSGEQEATMAGQGVLSGIPDADGLVGDLGGGSLELVDIAGGQVRASISLPFGVLRLTGAAAIKPETLQKKLAKALDALDFRKRGRKRPFYLVGGSWRALARLDMLLTRDPLPIMHGYTMAPGRLAELHKALTTPKPEPKSAPAVSEMRLPQLPAALALLRALTDELKPSQFVVSSFGIREGLLFDGLRLDQRQRDPLIEGAREAGRTLGRFAEHGALLDRWIAPAFDDPPAAARLRLAACLLADVAWTAHPDYRAERGVYMALHGNWVGVDGPGRVTIAQALFTNFGGGRTFADNPAARLCSPDVLARAAQWGLAMRLGQRLSGGVAASLERTILQRRDGRLRLELKRADQPLYGESVERRLHTLANALGLTPEAVAV